MGLAGEAQLISGCQGMKSHGIGACAWLEQVVPMLQGI
jgi:hypothetical protein